jgi:glycosyltransferase involved in cell wall biosynthesis
VRYVVAFNRDRDFYQVPLALAEADALAGLVTDLYVPDALSGWSFLQKGRIAHRRVDGLPSRLVEWSIPALWNQLVGLRLAKDEEARVRVFKSLDKALSRQALKLARRKDAGFLLYSGYALEAFREADASCQKLLFVFHPHGGLSGEILEADFAEHPEMQWSHELHMREIALSDSARLDEELRIANGLICASGFTRKSVQRVVGAETPVHVVPYGCFPAATDGAGHEVKNRVPQILFVGQGMQRKGIHHLLKIWDSRPTWGAELTLVLNRVDPAVERMLAGASAVRVLSGLSRADLQAEFERADVFVMPSLVEGFGLVYLEALSTGCHVIGTPNTGLPDLEAPPEVATVVPTGDMAALERELEEAISRARRGELDRAGIRRFANTRTWAAFREGIRNSIRS